MKTKPICVVLLSFLMGVSGLFIPALMNIEEEQNTVRKELATGITQTV